MKKRPDGKLLHQDNGFYSKKNKPRIAHEAQSPMYKSKFLLKRKARLVKLEINTWNVDEAFLSTYSLLVF